MRRSTTTGRRSVGLYCVNQTCCSAIDNVSLSVQESLSLRRAVDTRLHPPSVKGTPATVTVTQECHPVASHCAYSCSRRQRQSQTARQQPKESDRPLAGGHPREKRLLLSGRLGRVRFSPVGRLYKLWCRHARWSPT